MQSIYHISPHYRLLTIWQGSAVTNQRFYTYTRKPDAGQSKAARHAQICKALREHGIKAPKFNETY